MDEVIVIGKGVSIEVEANRVIVDHRRGDDLASQLEVAIERTGKISEGLAEGVDYPAVHGEARRLEIELSICTMNKIKALEAAVIAAQHKDN